MKRSDEVKWNSALCRQIPSSMDKTNTKNFLLLICLWGVLNANETTRLEEINIITTKKSDTYKSSDKVNLNRTTISKEDSAKSIQTFNQAFIEDAKASNIDDIIKMSSNTVYTGDLGGIKTNITMRGFSDVPILFDSIKYTNPVAHPEVFNLEAIEVLKGPNSLQYGKSSPGGIVNLVAKKPTKRSLAKIQLETTNNPSYKPKLDIGGSLNYDKSIYFRLTSVLEYNKDYINSNTKKKKIFIAPSLAYDMNDNNTITFISEYTNDQSPSKFGTVINNKGKFVIPIKTNISHLDEKIKSEQKVVGFDLSSIYDTSNQDLKYRYFNNIFDAGVVYLPMVYIENTNTIRRFIAQEKVDTYEHALQYTLNEEFKLFDKKNILSIGADYNKSYSKTQTGMISTPFDINAKNPIYGIKPNSLYDLGLPIIDISAPKSYIETYGVFLQENLYLSNSLIFSAAVRYSKSNPQRGQKSDATTPSFGLVYHHLPQITFFSNYSQSFNPNSELDINGKVLKPQKGEGYEIGIKQNLFDNSFDLTASIFKINKNNIAQIDPNDMSGTRYKASGKQESQGFEFDLNAEPTQNLQLIASYGYTKAKNKMLNDNDLRFTPNHTANLFATYKLASLNLPNYYISAQARYLGTRYLDDTNSIKLDSVVIYNATIGYKKKNWKANLSIQNLTNEEYADGSYTGTSLARIYVGAPRLFLASVSYTF